MNGQLSREDGIEKRGYFQTLIQRQNRETWPSGGGEGEMQKWMESERKMCQGQGNRKATESLSTRKEPQAVRGPIPFPSGAGNAGGAVQRAEGRHARALLSPAFRYFLG